jgi:hypothetical protein
MGLPSLSHLIPMLNFIIAYMSGEDSEEEYEVAWTCLLEVEALVNQCFGEFSLEEAGLFKAKSRLL